MSLTDADRRILEFEGSWWTRPGAKNVAIRGELGVSPTTYYRRLATLMDDDDALRAAPMVVRRLRRRRRDERRDRLVGAALPDQPRR